MFPPTESNVPPASVMWRITHSVWSLWTFLTFGLATWIGFLYIGIRARNTRWLLFGLLWFVVSTAVLIVTPTSEDGQPTSDWTAVGVMGLWVLAIVHTARTLPTWWRWRQEHPPVWTTSLGAPHQDNSASQGEPLPLASPQAIERSGISAPNPPLSETPLVARQEPTGFQPLSIGTAIPGLGKVDDIPEDGYGSFGTVHRIRRDFDGRHVAGKLFRIPRGPHGAKAADKALRDEVVALESLRHVNIVGVMNPVPLGDGSWMLVSEWIEGRTLETACLGVDPMSGEQVYSVGLQLLDALCYLEDEGVVHRDIKPTNVMVDTTGTVKLIDFNLTRASGRETALAGTRPYLPPDYMDGFVVDSLVDRYAVGVVLFELTTGKHPYMEYEHAAVAVLPNSVPADPTAFRPDLGIPVATFLTRAVQPVESSRFANAQQMRNAWIDAHQGHADQPLPQRRRQAMPHEDSPR